MTEVAVVPGKAANRDVDERTVERLRTRPLLGGVLVSDCAGRFMLAETSLADRLHRSAFNPGDVELLQAQGLIPRDRLGRLALVYARERRRLISNKLDYLILVPTLRCNLACSYCQVSRAGLDTIGFDWSDETLKAVLARVAALDVKSVKIEFQGGEPTLRPDLIAAVIDAVPAGVEARFVICTNLQAVDDRLLSLFDRDDVSISTSLDGPLPIHARQRHGEMSMAKSFLDNVRMLIARYGPDKISALPTIDPLAPPDADTLIESYAELGFTSVFLRPVNYQGFARKRYPVSRNNSPDWLAYHRAFVDRLIERNWEDRSQVFEESYFSLLLRRIFRPGEDRHVDLRNPNPVGHDYIVMDFDGRVYPTDEARMLTRSGIIDLAIGDVHSGWDTPARAALDSVSTNDGDPACEACTYQPYCGRDIIDDIARYGRIDVPRLETDFCRRHLSLFDHAFELIHSTDPAVQYSLRRWLGLAGETGALVVR